MARPAGFIIDVPVTLSVSVRGTTLKEAQRIAREFADMLAPSEEVVSSYNYTAKLEGVLPEGVKVTEASFEASREDSPDVLDELEADDEDYD